MGTVLRRYSANMKLVLLLCLVGTAFGGVPSCKTVYDEKCWEEPRQHCDYVQKPHTTTHYEQECHTTQVPKVESVPEQKCTDVPEQKCHTRYENKVEYVTKQKPVQRYREEQE